MPRGSSSYKNIIEDRHPAGNKKTPFFFFSLFLGLQLVNQTSSEVWKGSLQSLVMERAEQGPAPAVCF